MTVLHKEMHAALWGTDSVHSARHSGGDAGGGSVAGLPMIIRCPEAFPFARIGTEEMLIPWRHNPHGECEE